MRLPRFRFTIKRMMIAVAVLSIGAWAIAEYQRNGTYYAAGWWDAELELWRGEATIYWVGGLVMGDVCNIDPDTGLGMRARSGCVNRTGDSDWVRGHNDHIAQYIRRHGLPENTLKPWAQELFNLYDYFDDRSRTDVPSRLFAGGAAIVSPDGRNSVRLVAGVKDDGSPGDWLWVIITAGHVVHDKGYIRPEKGDFDLLWGPEGSRFAVIRSVSEKREHYVAYDLRTGRHLRDETWDEWKLSRGRARAKPSEYRAPIAIAPLSLNCR
jgi:hypothetical protein